MPNNIFSVAFFILKSPHVGQLSFDTRSLSIHQILSPITLSPLPVSLSPSPDPIKGTQLSISLPDDDVLNSFFIVFSTSPSSSALQWLSPPQTFNKKHPFVYTQCQCIHARSIFPCQDTPAARIRYSALLNVPRKLSAVMSTRHVDRRSPVSSEGHSHLLPGGFNSLRFFRTLLLSTVVWGNQSTTDLRERKRKEMLRDMWRGHKLLKYAFKSKDHTYFRGAHGFMRTHKWRHSIGAFINVEASGTGGLDLVCQSGPGSWPSSVYAKSAIYPMAHSAAQGGFWMKLAKTWTK